MRKKMAIILFSLFVLSIFNTFNINISDATIKCDFALLISGTNILGQLSGNPKPTLEPLRDCYYMFHILVSHWGVPRDHIKFLHINPLDQYPPEPIVPQGTIDGDCSYSSVKAAIDWLKAHSTSNDNVLIFIASHGGGYYPGVSLERSGGRIDYSGDEGSETWDGSNWYGVDECILFDDVGDSSRRWWYWDDNLKSDLVGMSYNQLVIVFMSCFSGGFIDDLSAPNRIVITSSKETTTTQVSTDIAAGFTPFIGHFLDAFNGDALHRYHAVWNASVASVNNRIGDQCEITVPDKDCDGVDWRNAYAYARDQYPDDNPWFDSNGNGIPTYKDGQDYIEYFLYIWHNWGGYTTPDTGGYEYSPGTVVSVYATAYSGYHFDHWLIDNYIPAPVGGNPRSQTMDRDHMLKCYFESNGGGGGGGDGCPKLYTWNGLGYVDYGVINIHNPSGEDVIREVPIAKQDLAVEGFKTKIRLQEGWEGLNYSHSEIDQVKLYAIVNGKRLTCPLTKATYINQYNIWLYLIASDNQKWDIYLHETIDLEFAVPYQNIQSFTFTIEGCNQQKM